MVCFVASLAVEAAASAAVTQETPEPGEPAAGEMVEIPAASVVTQPDSVAVAVVLATQHPLSTLLVGTARTA